MTVKNRPNSRPLSFYSNGKNHCFKSASFYAMVIFLMLHMTVGHAQTVCTAESKDRLDFLLTSLSGIDVSQTDMNQLVVNIGEGLIGTPYVEKTLEIQGDEKLVINLVGLDCTTFLETVVTLARLAKTGSLSYEDYEHELEFIRYRDGAVEQYPSRLHYFSDWIYHSVQKGIIEDITKEIGGVVYPNKPSFMSANPKLYAQLSNPVFVDQIRQAEEEIASRVYYYLPKETVAEHEAAIRPGDLIAITIALENLDISHVGIAVQQNGRIHLMHASSNSMKVEISDKPLSEYLLSHKSQTGIMVCRLIAPK